MNRQKPFQKITMSFLLESLCKHSKFFRFLIFFKIVDPPPIYGAPVGCNDKKIEEGNLDLGFIIFSRYHLFNQETILV